MRKKLPFIIFWVVISVAFVFFASILIMEANGYRLNFANFSVQKTAIIVLKGDPRLVTLVLNGKEKEISLPLRLTKLLPGQYEVTIKKEGYQNWSKTYKLEGGQAVEAGKILLFKNGAALEKQTYDASLASKILKNSQNQSEDVVVSGNEIWYEEKLMTRYFEQVYSVYLTRDRGHIISQVGNQIRSIDVDGSNDIKLVDLPIEYDNELQKYPNVPFMISSNQLYVLIGEEIYQAQIR